MEEVTEQPELMLELLGAARLPTDDARGAEEMAPLEGSGGELRVRRVLARGLLFVLPIACKVKIRLPPPLNVILTSKLSKIALGCTMYVKLRQFINAFLASLRNWSIDGRIARYHIKYRIYLHVSTCTIYFKFYLLLYACMFLLILCLTLCSAWLCNGCSLLVFLHHDFSVAGRVFLYFIPALFLYFLQTHPYL